MPKHRIPTRTWADRAEDRPGLCEIDLADHSGGWVTRGREHARTLSSADVKTGWTDCVAVRNKAQVHVFAPFQRARQRLPCHLSGIDSDNGAKFINDEICRYCLAEQITFPHGRAGRKNDSTWVDQKTGSIVRRAVGYWRYDSPQQLDLLNTPYAHLHHYVDFFLRVTKLEQKVPDAAKPSESMTSPRAPMRACWPATRCRTRIKPS